MNKIKKIIERIVGAAIIVFFILFEFVNLEWAWNPFLWLLIIHIVYRIMGLHKLNLDD